MSGALEVGLQRYLRHLAIERGLAHNTQQAYRRDLGMYLDWLSGEGVGAPGEVDEAHIAGFVQHVRSRPERPLTASSTARVLSSVRGLHRFWHEEGLTGSNPALRQRPPKQPLRLPRAITIEQMAALLAATEGEETAQLRDRALLELLYATGARISEAVALNVDDVIDTELGAAEALRLLGKGGKQRIVPVGSYARTALEAYLVRGRPALSVRGPATPALFLGMRGARLSRQGAWLVIQSAAQRAKLEVPVSPHTFRHSFATHLLAGGADVRVVQELLGHASVATTQLYTKVTADSLRDMYTMAHPRAR